MILLWDGKLVALSRGEKIAVEEVPKKSFCVGAVTVYPREGGVGLSDPVSEVFWDMRERIEVISTLGKLYLKAPFEGFVETSTLRIFLPGRDLWEMHLESVWLEKILEGKKTVEARLFDEKRSKIRPGHVIMFLERDGDRTIFCQVMDVRVYSSFKELLLKEGLGKVMPGASTLEEALEVLNTYYSGRSEPPVAIEIKLLV